MWFNSPVLLPSFGLNPFQCQACRTPSISVLCKFCRRFWIRQSQLVPGLLQGQHHASIWQPNELVYQTFRNWKQTGGSSLEHILFSGLEPALKESLRLLKLGAVTWIPQDRSRSWMRGLETAQRCAQFFARELELPLEETLILNPQAHRRVLKMSHQGRLERSWAPNPFLALQPPTTPILLVDDLLTTGTTLAFGVEALIQGGFDFRKIVTASVLMRPRKVDATQVQRTRIQIASR